MMTISKKAELFDKAIVDLWQAEQAANFRADATIYNCSQCVEKMVKGVLRCYDIDYEYDHDLDKTYSKIIESKEIITLKDLSKSVATVGLWGNSIRYKSMSNDPSIQDGIKVYNTTKEIVESLSSLTKAKPFYIEAFEYNRKLLKQSEELIKKNDISKIFDDKKT